MPKSSSPDAPLKSAPPIGRRDKVLGVTRDGVRILEPKGRATHFTRREIREAISIARGVKQSG